MDFNEFDDFGDSRLLKSGIGNVDGACSSKFRLGSFEDGGIVDSLFNRVDIFSFEDH